MQDEQNALVCPVCGSGDVMEVRGMGVCFACRAKFELPKTDEEPFQPLSLFLSYGHPEAEICRRIVAALRERGHKVWMDEDKIHTGDDWRRRIMQGVSESQGVVSCLSRHSVRDPGVCLDELSIAIGVSGGNIKTVLLEPERLVEPPPSLCHLQWLDMSEWKQKLSEGEAAFEPWFKDKMEQLIKVIESPDSQEFAGQIAELKKKLYVNYSTGKQRDLLSRLFVGRGWLTQEVEDWLNDPNGNRLCVLYGDPGVGKSAFAAHYIHYNPRVAAGLFCEFSHPHYNEPRTLLMTLAYLLACRIPDYRSALIASLEHEKRLGSMEPSELFDLLFTGPMGRLMVDGSRETLCVVIDGLDECSSGESNTVAQVLGQFAPRLPKWLRILVTAREVASVQEPLGGAHHLELHGAEARNLSDVEEYFKAILGERFGSDPEWNEALSALRERSGGIFLYAQLVAEGILSGKLTLRDTSSFPSGMSDAFHRWFTWFFPDVEEYKREWRPAFDLLLASSEPLPKDELREVLHWSDGKRKDFLRRVKVLLREGKNDWGKETVELTHLYLRQWLSSSGMYSASAVDGAEAMEREYMVKLRTAPKDLSEYGALYLAAKPGIDSRLTEDERHNLVWRCIDAGDYCTAWLKYASGERALRLALTRAEAGAKGSSVSRTLRDYGVSCNRLAAVLDENGDVAGALKLYEQGLQMAQRVVENGDRPGALKDLTISYNNVASIRRAQGDLRGALELYEKSLAIREKLYEERRTPTTLRDLSISCNMVATVREDLWDLDGALELYERALAIREELAREDSSTSARRDLSISYSKVAALLQKLGNYTRAKELFEKDLELAEGLVRELGTPDARRSLSICYNKLAKLYKALGDLPGALEYYKMDYKLSEELAQEGGTPTALRDLNVSCNAMGDTLKAMGDLDGALEQYMRALALAERVVKMRDVPDARRDLSVSYNKIAGLLEAKGDLDGALKYCEMDLAISEELARMDNSPECRRDLSISYSKISTVLLSKGDLQRAMEYRQKDIAIAEQLVRDNESIGTLGDLSVSYDKAAKICLSLKDYERARYYYGRSIELSERVVKRSDSTSSRRDLAITYYLLADVLKEQGDNAGALELYEKGNAVIEHLAGEDSPLKLDRTLAMGHDEAGELAASLGRDDAAMAHYDRQIELRELIVKKDDTPQTQRGLFVSYFTCASSHETNGDLAGAYKLFERASVLAMETFKRQHGTPESRRDVCVCVNRLGSVAQSMGDNERAIQLFERSLKLTEELYRKRGSAGDLDDLGFVLYKLVGVPGLGTEKRRRMAEYGLIVAKKLNKDDPKERYEIMCSFFKSKL